MRKYVIPRIGIPPFSYLPKDQQSSRSTTTCHTSPDYPRPTIEPVADLREFSLASGTFTTRCGGLFLFVPDLVPFHLGRLAAAARLPGSKMIPAEYALRACLALKFWSLKRKSHVMALVADEGLTLFAGLNAFPKKSAAGRGLDSVEDLYSMGLTKKV